MIRVVICDDQDLVREGLAAILGAASGIEVVGVAEDGAAAVELAAALQPDVVLMDLNMPGMTGLQATRLIRARSPGVKVLILTTYATDDWVFDAIRAGAAGYLLKDTPRAGLVRAIVGTVAGQTFVDPQVAGKLFSHIAGRPAAPDAPSLTDLTPREREVLRLLGQGCTNAEIAQRLFLAEGTVRNLVSAVLAKLGVADRTQAAVVALRAGLVD